MIFRKGQRCKELPAGFHSVVSVCRIDDNESMESVMLTQMYFLERERREKTDPRFYIAAVSDSGYLHIHPEPRTQIKLVVRYYVLKEC